MDRNTRLLRISIGGTVITALCCFTPILVVLLGVIGAAAWVGYLDFMLLPALAVFIGITLYEWRRCRQAQACCTPNLSKEENENERTDNRRHDLRIVR